MINIVERQSSTYNDIPHKFEAGTPNISEVISLGASIDFLNQILSLIYNSHSNENIQRVGA